jgi:hypothetical protein
MASTAMRVTHNACGARRDFISFTDISASLKALLVLTPSAYLILTVLDDAAAG